MTFSDTILFLILLPPFIGAMLAWIGDNFWNKFSRYLGVGTIAISGISAVIAFIMSLGNNWDATGWASSEWIPPIGTNSIQLVIQPDALGLFMALVTAFLSALIAIFSLEYMKNDKHLTRYWFYLQLFVGGMLLLVLGGDLILMYVGWEIIGLCSYGLIAHWHTNEGEQGEKCAKAGIKAFVFTRIGDIGFLVAIVMIYNELGTVTLSEIKLATGMDIDFLGIIGVCFLMAAFGKSAQFPFIPWLSSPENVDVDAMQGPTTVSALIHAATMVKAGVYLIGRIFLTIPVWRDTNVTTILVVIAGVTALLAALSALVSFDIKRILAYSTVSQLAYMFLGLGIAFISMRAELEHLSYTAFLSTQFHLISHAIFKSLLFLTAGYLIHKLGSRDIRDLKVDRKSDLPGFVGLVVGGLALAGIFPLNGFWSKEAIVGISYAAYRDGADPGITLTAYIFAVVTALVTALYVARMLYYLLFVTGEKTEGHAGSSKLMVMVIYTLSALVVLGGLFQIFLDEYFDTMLPGISFHHLEGGPLFATILLTLVLIGVVAGAFRMYQLNPKLGDRVESILIFRWIATWARAGFYLEAIWMGLFNLLKKAAYAFRKTHTGDLNNTMALISVLSLVMVLFSLGGAI